MRLLLNLWLRFFNLILIACGCVYVFENTISRIDSIQDARWYRDWQEQTPFYDVVTYQTRVVGDGLIANGEMKKRRCDFVRLYGIATFDDAPFQRIPLDDRTELFGIHGNRTPSENAQTWGPWLLEWPHDYPPHPDGYRIDVGHLCPLLDDNGSEVLNPATGEPRVVFEINVFAEGRWDEMK